MTDELRQYFESEMTITLETEVVSEILKSKPKEVLEVDEYHKWFTRIFTRLCFTENEFDYESLTAALYGYLCLEKKYHKELTDLYKQKMN